MTEQEREEIVRQMAVAIRKQKFARTGRIGCFDETNITDDELSEARAALAAAEPVIREQADIALREENARLRELLDDVFAQWDGDWPEELVKRVKAAISGERATGGP